MTTMAKRLDRLARVYHHPEPPPPMTVIPGALTPREEYELDQLLACVEPQANGRSDFRALSDAEFARLYDLYSRYTGEPPDAA